MTKGLLPRRARCTLAVALAALALSCGPERGPATTLPVRAHVVRPAAVARSAVRRLVVVEQENHTFDAYFGRWCTGAPGVSCTLGRGCCEAAPARAGPCAPGVLDDAVNGAQDLDHSAAAEWERMRPTRGGFTMDAYPCEAVQVAAAPEGSYAEALAARGPSGVAHDFPLSPYHRLAEAGALADRYFQPIVGASSSNDMFLARAGFVFEDNRATPGARGYLDLTLGDLLDVARVPWSVFAEGVDGGGVAYDPSDNPFEYYARTQGRALDAQAFFDGAHLGTLPAVSLVRPHAAHSEHPGKGVTITDGEAFVRKVVDAVAVSPLAADTLVLVTWDEGGGFWDHVPPPLALADGSPLPSTPPVGEGRLGDSSTLESGARVPATTGDPEFFSAGGQALGREAYGTRVPLLALGPLARAGAVSHVVLEHSSIVKFVEWNWLGGASLGTRDVHVNNLGSLLDPALGVPEGVEARSP